MPPASTDPAFWFLTDRENGDSNLQVFSSNNRVEALVDGGLYMNRVHTAITGASSGDYLLIAGWRMDGDQQLLLGTAASRVDTIVDAAHRAGVHVRIMLSDHVANDNKTAWRWFNGAGIPCIRDARHPTYGSAHQKFVVVGASTGMEVFLGGIDLALDRWDVPAHDSNPARQVDDYPGGWHDVGCSVSGPVCRDLDETFRERWNDRRRPRLLEAAPPRFTRPVAPTPNAGPHHVQVLRTYACDVGYPFALRGEFSSRRAWLKAIGLANDYIYIEDQYYVSYEFNAALIARLAAVPSLRVIVVLPQAVRPARAFNFHQHQLLTTLAAAAPGRVGVYHLTNRTPAHGGTQIYVHSKKMIVDDVWVGIGSMNLNRRSMTHDAELAVAVVDATVEDGVCVFARDLRRTLWAEHLMVPPGHPSIQDPVAGFAFWATRSGSAPAHADLHVTATPRSDSMAWNSIIDPQGLCPGTPRLPP